MTLIAGAGIVFAQAQSVTGYVKDDRLNNLINVSVMIRKANGGAVVKFGLTDTAGKFVFTGVPQGDYFIHTTHVGYEQGKSGNFKVDSVGDVAVPDLVIKRIATELKEVNVTAKAPPVEMREGKLVVNVEANINSVGLNALEILSKSPGVMVSRDDQVSISGRNGVRLYVNGRSLPLGGKDLSEYLKTIQAANIQSIEIITHPSARYEAAGSAGIINIKLKKNESIGTNGTVSAGYNAAIYSRPFINLNINHRDRKFNLYGNYGVRDFTNKSFQNLKREVADTLFDQSAEMKNQNRGFSHRTGIDYTIDKRQSLGIMVDGYWGDNSFESKSTTPIIYKPSKEVKRILVANNNSNGFRSTINVNGNYQFADTNGHELVIDGNYATFDVGGKQYQPNWFFDESGNNLQQERIVRILTANDLVIRNLKVDYEFNLLKGKLGLGVKTSFVTSDNDFGVYEVDNNGIEVQDTSRSNFFRYKENIHAAYVMYNRSLKAWSFQAGLRVENTNVSGILNGYRLKDRLFNKYDTTFTRHYTDPFPSASVTYKKNPNQQWSLNIARRIDRPVYQNLNPFETRLDEYSFQKGNPELKPQYTHSIGLTYMYKFRLVAMLSYSHINNMFSQITDTTDRSKIIITYQNLATQDVTSLNVSYPVRIKWFNAFFNANAYYSTYKADFGMGRTINLNAFVYKINLMQAYELGKTLSIQVNSIFNSPSITQGTYKTRSTWGIDLGVSKSFYNKRAGFRLGCNDIFYTMPWKASSNFAGQQIWANGRSETRQLVLNFSYRFGSSKIKVNQIRKGAEEEIKRVKTE